MNLRERALLRFYGAEPLVGSAHEDDVDLEGSGVAIGAEDRALFERLVPRGDGMPGAIPDRLRRGGTNPRSAPGLR